MNFETAFNRLQEISKALENKNTDLEEAEKLYDEAKGLIKKCEEFIADASARIEKSDNNGEA